MIQTNWLLTTQCFGTMSVGGQEPVELNLVVHTMDGWWAPAVMGGTHGCALDKRTGCRAFLALFLRF